MNTETTGHRAMDTSQSLTELHSDPRLADELLVRKGLAGDQEAFNILFSRYRPLLYRLAYRIVRNNEEAEDAVQNCSLLAFCKLEDFQQAGAFRNWLARILINEAIAILRKKKRQPVVSPVISEEEREEIFDSLPHPGPNPEQILHRKQTTRTLVSEISRLGSLQRSALLLCGVYKYTAQEASVVLKVPASTIRSRLFRARRRLAAALGMVGNVSLESLSESESGGASS